MSFPLTIIALLTFLIPLVVANRYGVIRYFSPLHILAYLVLFGVTIKTIYMYAFDGVMFFQNFLHNDLAAVEGYLFVLGFVILICAGYVLAANRAVEMPSRSDLIESVASVRNVRTLMAFALVAALAVLIYMLNIRELGGLGSLFNLETVDALNSSKIVRIEGESEFGASGSAVKVFLVYPTLCLVLFLARNYIWRRELVPLLFFVALEFFLVLTQGKRFGLLITLMYIMMVPILLGGRYTPRQLVTAVVGLFAVMTLFVAMTTFRDSKGATEDAEFELRPAIESVVGSTYFLDVNSPILIIALSDPNDRFNGASYFYWTYAWVPRAIWADKPVVSIGPYVKREVLGMEQGIGGVNPTGAGEAFLNFGWFGILVGLALGVLFRALEVLCLSKAGVLRRYGLWMYPIIVVPFVIGALQSSFSGTLVTAVAKALLLFGLLLLISKRRTAPQQRQFAT